MNIFSCFRFNILIRFFINNINFINSTIDIITSNIIIINCINIRISIMNNISIIIRI